MNIQKKKGINLNQSFAAVLMVVLVAVLVIVAIFMFDALQGSFTSSSVSVADETGATISTAEYQLAGASDCNYADGAITTAKNATSGQTILSGNYTLSTTGWLTNATSKEWEAVNLTYTYTSSEGGACDAAAETISQFGTYPALVGLVGTIVFLGLVIGVLVGSFIFGRRRDTI